MYLVKYKDASGTWGSTQATYRVPRKPSSPAWAVQLTQGQGGVCHSG